MSKKLIIIGVTLVIATVGFFLLTKSEGQTTTEPVAEPIPEQPDTSMVETPAESTSLESKMYDVIRNYPGLKIGVSVNDIGSDNIANISKDYSFIAASTTKVLIAAYTYDQAEKGNINLDDILVPKTEKDADYKAISFRDNIRWMIVNSDNESWKDLMEYFGYNNIDSYVNGLGYNSFTTDGNVISANDMAGFLRQLQKGELIKEANQNELLGFMSKSWTGPLELKTDYQELSKKTGWLEDRMHFVGIIGTGENQKTFSIYSETTDQSVIDYTYSTGLINDLLDVISTEPV